MQRTTTKLRTQTSVHHESNHFALMRCVYVVCVFLYLASQTTGYRTHILMYYERDAYHHLPVLFTATSFLRSLWSVSLEFLIEFHVQQFKLDCVHAHFSSLYSQTHTNSYKYTDKLANKHIQVWIYTQKRTSACTRSLFSFQKKNWSCCFIHIHAVIYVFQSVCLSFHRHIPLSQTNSLLLMHMYMYAFNAYTIVGFVVVVTNIQPYNW